MSVQPDFRAKIVVIVLTMSLVALLTSDILAYVLTGLLALYLLAQGYFGATVKYLSVMAVVVVVKRITGSDGLGVIAPELFLFILSRVSMMLMAAHPVLGMPPGEAVAVFRKLRAPAAIAMPATFMLRFFPTAKSEFRSVFAAMRLRGLLCWRKPLQTLECSMVPVMFRASRIAEELAASAESRGISNPGVHTCRRVIAFRGGDWLLCGIAVLAAVALVLLQRVVPL